MEGTIIMFTFILVCYMAVVVGFAVLLLIAALLPSEPTNQRTTYHEFRYGDRPRTRCRRHTRINH